MRFIIGIGRSGTSMIQSFLFHQPGLSVFPEFQLVRRFIIANNIDHSYSEDQFYHLLKKNNPRYSHIKPLVEEMDIKFPLSGRSFIHLLDDYYGNIVFKDARNIDYIEELINTLEAQCSFLLCVRDIRDVLHSRRQADFSKKWTFLLDLFICKFQINGYLTGLESAEFTVIRFEDFLKGDLSSITEFSGVTDLIENPDLAVSSKQLYSSEELLKHKSKVKEKIFRKNYGKWLNQSNVKIWIIDTFFYDYHTRFGYPPKFQDLFLRIGNSSINILIKILYPVYKFWSKKRDVALYRL